MKLYQHHMIHKGEIPNICLYAFIQLGMCKSRILKAHSVEEPRGTNMKTFVEGISNGANFAVDVNMPVRGGASSKHITSIMLIGLQFNMCKHNIRLLTFY